MPVQDDLLATERALWSGGPEAYHEHLDDRCLVAFTRMAGVAARADVAATVGEGDRWRDLEIDVEGLIQPSDRVVLLTYRARAVRGDDEVYRALVSSGYVERDGSWRLMFHQQTPLTD